MKNDEKSREQLILELEQCQQRCGQTTCDLRQAVEAVEEARRVKSAFLAKMSHEIRTPMNSILGLSELILAEDLPPRAREYLLLVQQSGQNLLTVINDILDISKIDAGGAELERKEFNLCDVLDDIIGPLAFGAPGERLHIFHYVDPEVPCDLVGDQGRLRQVLNNLLSNAIKFTHKGQVRLTVELAGKPGLGSVSLLFSVMDNGVGIPSDKLGHLFESFAQVGSSAHTQYGGPGLGLSISKGLVAMMGGEISVSSKVGKGSTFSFTADFGLAEARHQLEPMVPSFSGPLRILLAEDDRPNQLLAMELLKQRGHQVTVAGNGREAIEKLAASDFDLVFMDVAMPDMDGLEAVAAIREGRAGPGKAQVTVAALTAYALSGDRERFLAAGMDDYLAKPIDTQELDRVLAKVMAMREKGDLHLL